MARVAAMALFIVVFVTSTAYAQEHTVSGTVSDTDTGEPLPGVNVQVEDTNIGTATNPQGEYEITAPSADATLLFSFVGYQRVEEPIDGRSTVDVTLESETLTGGEVVVTGFSTQRRADLTGSIEVADVDNMQSLSTPQVTEQLQGQVSGVTINTSGQPGEQPQINIRGFNTFGNNQPLFVVDGVPTQDISHLNPQDVESLQVLKDGGAASQYGARAANGVVIITTQRGERDGIQVNYSAQVGTQVPDQGNVWNALSPQEFGELEWMARQNSGETAEEISHPVFGSGTEPRVPDFLTDGGGVSADEVDFDDYFVIPEYTDPSLEGDFFQIAEASQQGTNWYEEVFSPAMQMQHNLSVGGGGDIGTYFVSLNYTNQEGTLMNTHLERYTVRANSEFNVSDNFRIGENIAFSVTENPQSGQLTEGGGIGMSYRQNTVIPVRDIEGNFAGTRTSGLGNPENPVAIRDRAGSDDGQERRLFGNVFAELDFLEAFSLRTSFGADITSGYSQFFTYPQYENSENTTTNAYTEQAFNDRSWTWTNTLSYESTLGQRHNVEALVGTEAVQNTFRFDNVSRQSYFSFNPNFTNLQTGSGDPTVNESARSVDALLSLIGRIDYDYDNTYLLSFTVRRDGSSRFLENQWGTFPSVTAGWRASQLPFFQDIDWLTDLKLRGGYGTMGNQLNVAPDNAFTLFAGSEQNSFYPIDGAQTNLQQGFRQTRIGNPGAEWERVVDVNVGVDLAVFGGQLEVAADYYRKEVQDLLFDPELPAGAGAAAPPFQNVANMRNQGVDLSLRGGTDITSDLTLNAQLSFTTYDNEILSIAEGIEQFSLDERRFGDAIIRNEVGHPISSFYGFEVEGFWTEDKIEEYGEDYQNDMGVGRFKYRDVTGDGQITADDRTHLGNPHPNFTYGLNLGATYRGWDARVFLYGEQGKDIWNQVRWWTDFYGSFNGAKSETALYDSWTEDNPDATAPIQEDALFESSASVPNSYFVEDGSYFRVRNIMVGYTLEPDVLQQAGLGSVRLYAQAENVLTITGYSGVDPEIGATGSAEAGTTNFGIDEGAFATPRTFTLGVDVSF